MHLYLQDLVTERVRTHCKGSVGNIHVGWDAFSQTAISHARAEKILMN